MEETGEIPLGDLSWTEIQMVINELEARKDYTILWELAKCVPAAAAVRILAKLGRTTWEPETEYEAYRDLVDKALDAERETAPFRSLVFPTPQFEDLTIVTSFEYVEKRDTLIAVDMQEAESRLRTWDLETGALKQTLTGPTTEDGLFEPLQLASSKNGEWALTVHLGGRLCLWSLEAGTASLLPESSFAAMTASTPFALWVDNRFAVCGDDGHLGMLDPATETVERIRIADTETPVISVCEGTTAQSIFALTDGGSVVTVQTNPTISHKTIWSGTKNAKCLHFGSVMGKLLIGTHRGEILSVDPGTRSVASSEKDRSLDTVLAIDVLNNGAQVVVGHPGGFMIRDGQTLDPLVYVPRKQALPMSPRGTILRILSGQEHGLFRDYSGNLRKLAFRFALLPIVPVAKLSMPVITGMEIARESAPGWVDFVQLLAGYVADETVIPKWELTVALPDSEATSGATRVGDKWTAEEVPPPVFPGPFGVLPDDE
jgi:hypothetical protein